MSAAELLAREFAHLEELGEVIIEAPADASTLKDILEEYLAKIFPVERAEIRLFDEEENVWSAFRFQSPWLTGRWRILSGSRCVLLLTITSSCPESFCRARNPPMATPCWSR